MERVFCRSVSLLTGFRFFVFLQCHGSIFAVHVMVNLCNFCGLEEQYIRPSPGPNKVLRFWKSRKTLLAVFCPVKGKLLLSFGPQHCLWLDIQIRIATFSSLGRQGEICFPWKLEGNGFLVEIFFFSVQFHSPQMLFMEFVIGSSWEKFIKSIKLRLLYADFFLCSAGNNRGPDAAPYETCAVRSNPLKQMIRTETQCLKKKNRKKLSRSQEELSLGKWKKTKPFPLQLHCPKPLMVGERWPYNDTRIHAVLYPPESAREQIEIWKTENVLWKWDKQRK